MKKYLALGLAALLAIGATIVPDAYDKLFLRMDGTTTTFVDSSTANPKTITANGNATQLPIKFNKSAGFFNGTTDYVDISNSTDFAFGTGAFTIEGFFNTGIAATAQTILDTRAATANTTGLLVNIINSTGNKLCVTTATTARITGTTTLAKNTWYHFMVVGNGGANGARTIILYLDGVQEGSTYTNDYNFTDQTLRIGAIKAAAGTYMNGWMKELRISNVARTVAVPTAQYKSDANTVLLMHFDTPATSPLAPAIAFDGTGDYLALADHADWNFAKGDFTVEGWFWVPAIPGSYTGWVTSSVSGTGGWALWPDTGGVIHFAKTGITDAVTSGTLKIEAARWNHVAVVRKGTGATDLNIYVNGVAGGSPATGNVTLDSGGSGLLIGRFYTDHTSYCMTGSVREVRVSNSARYTSAFTPSQNGFTVDANTKLYIKGDENNGVTTFVDSSTSPKTITTNGDTKIKYTEDYRSCIFKDETGKFPYPVGSAKVDFFSAFGSGVVYFGDGVDCLLSENSTDWNLGGLAGGDFDVEAYVRWSSFPHQYFGLFSADNNAALGWNFYLRYDYGLRMWNGSAVQSFGTQHFLASTWYHLAFVRSGSTVTAYVNGTSVGTIADQDFNNDGMPMGIGTYKSSAPISGYGMVGLMDNIRISKGVARYGETAAFNPPDDYSAPRVGKRKTNWFFFF